MENVNSLSGKLLLLVYEMHQKNKMTLAEKSQLKYMIIQDAEDIVNVFENYLRCGTDLTLSSDLMHLIRLQNDKDSRIRRRRGSSSMEIIIPFRNIQKMAHIEGHV